MAELAEGAAIEARALRRSFGAFVAVDGLDLRVERGEVFGLLGANGAGKTTAIRMLCGTLSPSAGSVAVAGIDMRRHAGRARSRIGYVSQRFTLYGDLTVDENLRLQAGLYGLDAARREARIAWALERLRLRESAAVRAAGLPLGFQRRLSVAAALLHEPDVLFLDEPTSGADPLARQQLWELVYEMAAAGAGVLVTTHYLDEALFCDRLLLMDRGRVVAAGTPQALLKRPLQAPLLWVEGEDVAAGGPWLARQPGVAEVLPRAGGLQLRLRPGQRAGEAARRLMAGAAGQGLRLRALPQLEAELEDVFVDLLDPQPEVSP